MLSLGLTVGIGIAVTWVALFVAYYSPYPVGFFIATVAFALYLLARLAGTFADRVGTRRAGTGTGTGTGELERAVQA